MSPMNPKLLRPRLTGDPDALRYIAAVQAADGQTLEPAVAKAISDFVVGCKLDGIWTALKASCILMGARTLSGALTPLVGLAPTNNNFVSGDYNRKAGLVGDGATKWIDTNRNCNADPQDSQHLSVYAQTIPPSGGSGASNQFPVLIGSGGALQNASTIGRLDSNSNTFYTRSRSTVFGQPTGATSSGFIGLSRATSSGYTFRAAGTTTTISQVSSASLNGNIGVYRGGAFETVNTYGAGRFAFYSVGEALTLSLLDSRLTTLFNAIAAAI